MLSIIVVVIFHFVVVIIIGTLVAVAAAAIIGISTAFATITATVASVTALAAAVAPTCAAIPSPGTIAVTATKAWIRIALVVIAASEIPVAIFLAVFIAAVIIIAVATVIAVVIAFIIAFKIVRRSVHLATRIAVAVFILVVLILVPVLIIIITIRSLVPVMALIIPAGAASARALAIMCSVVSHGVDFWVNNAGSEFQNRCHAAFTTIKWKTGELAAKKLPHTVYNRHEKGESSFSSLTHVRNAFADDVAVRTPQVHVAFGPALQAGVFDLGEE